jgi:uncharacterized membrane protein (DUF2068 family)
MEHREDGGPARTTPALLWWIIAFKVVKAVSLFALGAALLRSRHMPPDALLLEVARTLHVPLSSRILQRAMAAAVSLRPRRELLLAFAAFAYGLLFTVEGIGLSRRAPWARWLTLVATTGLIPVELYEIARRPTLPRVLVLLVNLGVLVYLARRKELFEEREHCSRDPARSYASTQSGMKRGVPP